MFLCQKKSRYSLPLLPIIFRLIARKNSDANDCGSPSNSGYSIQLLQKISSLYFSFICCYCHYEFYCYCYLLLLLFKINYCSYHYYHNFAATIVTQFSYMFELNMLLISHRKYDDLDSRFYQYFEVYRRYLRRRCYLNVLLIVLTLCQQ